MTDKKRDFEVSDEVQEMTEATMLGALMQCVLEQCKALPKPWQALGEIEQGEYLARVELQCRNTVRQAIRLICAQDRVVIPATVNKVVFKDGVKAELELTPGAPGRHDLADAEGQIVHILIVDTTALDSSEGKPKPEKDQRDLPLDAEDVDPPEFEEVASTQVAIEDMDSVEKMPRAQRDALVKKAADLVVEYQIASTTFLQQKLGVSLHVVGQLLAVLASSGIVSAPNHEGLRTVLVVDGEVQESQQDGETAEEPPKGKRSCGCDIHDDELEGSLEVDQLGLQECPGFEARGDTADCMHCQHNEACHELLAEQAEALKLSARQLEALRAAGRRSVVALVKTAAGWQPSPGDGVEKHSANTVASLVGHGLLEQDGNEVYVTGAGLSYLGKHDGGIRG